MSEFKAWWQSKSVQQAIIALISAIVSLLSVSFGWGVETETMIVSAVSSMLAGIFRVTAKHQIDTGGQRGFVSIRMALGLLAMSIIFVLITAISGSILMGCTRYVKGDTLKMNVSQGPPCKVKVWMDGDLIQESEAKQPCKVTTDGQ